MYLADIKHEEVFGTTIIALTVRGDKAEREKFASDIQDFFDLAHDEWNETYKMLTLTFDKNVSEGQTLSQIKKYTKSYIDIMKKRAQH